MSRTRDHTNYMAIQLEQDESRRHPRTRIDEQVHISFLALAHNISRISLRITDVSESGISLLVDEQIPRDTLLKICLYDAILFGEVRYCLPLPTLADSGGPGSEYRHVRQGRGHRPAAGAATIRAEALGRNTERSAAPGAHHDSHKYRAGTGAATMRLNEVGLKGLTSHRREPSLSVRPKASQGEVPREDDMSGAVDYC
jgi:hypothetical protein